MLSFVSAEHLEPGSQAGTPCQRDRQDFLPHATGEPVCESKTPAPGTEPPLRWGTWGEPKPPPPVGPEWRGLEPPRSQGYKRVLRHVAGRSKAHPLRLAKALGRGAWAAWQALCDVRSGEGRVRITQASLARRLGKSPRYVERALRRLEAAGLVTRKGWLTELLPVPSGGRAMVEVYRRTVSGAWYGPRENGGLCWVPEETLDWLRGAHTWGGRRRGAGRPPKQSRGGESFAYPGRDPLLLGLGAPGINQEGAPEDTDPITIKDLLSKKKEATPCKSGVGYVRSMNQEGRPSTRPPNGLDPDRRWTKPAAECREALTLADLPADPERLPIRPLRESGPAKVSVADYALGAKGARPNREILSPGEVARLPGTPPIPNRGDIEIARVPPPPRLTEQMTPEERAQLMARAYRGAVQAKTGKPCWAFRGPDPRRWKDFGALVDCAEELLAEDISPAAWAAWSVDKWSEMKGRTCAPPVRWCYSASRVQERSGWFRSEELGYSGGRQRLGRMYKRLWEKWLGMAQEMGDPDNDPSMVLERWFPGDLYERMHETAVWEAKDYQRRLNEQKARGEWIWK